MFSWYEQNGMDSQGCGHLDLEAPAVPPSSCLLKLPPLWANVWLGVAVWHSWCRAEVLDSFPGVLWSPQENLSRNHKLHYRRPALCRVPSKLPSVVFRALGKDAFAECIFWHSAKQLFAECFFDTRQTPSLPSVFFYTRQTHSLSSFFFWPSVFRAALGKELVLRVPEGIYSANIKTLGKFEDSGSARLVVFSVSICLSVF